MIARDASTHELEARLAEAAEAGRTLEVILVLRGKARRASRPGRWRMRLADGGSATFMVSSIVAVTRVAPRARR